MKSKFSKLVSNFIERCIDEIKDKDNKDKINQVVVEPIITEINNKLFPYLLISLVLYVIILLLIIGILIAIICKKNAVEDK